MPIPFSNKMVEKDIYLNSLKINDTFFPSSNIHYSLIEVITCTGNYLIIFKKSCQPAVCV